MNKDDEVDGHGLPATHIQSAAAFSYRPGWRETPSDECLCAQNLGFALHGTNRLDVIQYCRSGGHSRKTRAPECLWRTMLAAIYADQFGSIETLLEQQGNQAANADLMLARARAELLMGSSGRAINALAPFVNNARWSGRGPIALSWITEALVQIGDLRTARQLLRDRGTVGTGTIDHAHVLMAEAALAHAEGDLAQCVTDYLKVGRILLGLGITNPAVFPWRSRAALTAVDAGRLDLATALAEDELASSRKWGSASSVGASLHAVAMARRDDHSSGLLEDATQLLRTVGVQFAWMAAQCDLGRLQAIEGSYAKAGTTLGAVAEAATTAGWTGLSERACTAMEAVDNLRAMTALTKQEQRIACQALNGSSNRDIARNLNLTVRTVEFHLSNVYRKLGIKGRRQLNSDSLHLGPGALPAGSSTEWLLLGEVG
ncbi:helix-turn-helix transcriptional regulator [Rhodococcus sp. IEGM 1330]|uniref:helix-turn-helix transcriptional regulator n=1 Tax=Rhodococcus sp. IEGM 1330 TaxID=3082225 RepID=UPI00295416D8|nr:helix-turn-helix transcriptional regulator [Rhodococcus sp. IEGM 1330]MDV8025331.1 helix-turn-helix transcriptional regulator [Rhodococcus sp. IEGM 1330]